MGHYPGSYESQSGQVNGSASGRHNIGPDFLKRYGETLGGLDGEERGDGNCEKCKQQEFLRVRLS